MSNLNVIFDFDGTLVDSYHAVIKNFNVLAKEFHFREVNQDEIMKLRDLTSKELIKFLNIPLYKIPHIILKARELMRKEITTLPPFAGLYDVLKNIHQSNITLGILTSNSSENVTEWLRLNHMQDFFNFIHVESSYFGKKRILKKIIKSYQFDKAKTFYIGDETRDIEAAKGCGINAVAVTWGMNSEKILLQHQPHFIARKPEDMLNIFSTIK